MKSWWTLVLVSTLGAVALTTAQAQTTDPANGTWVLNVAKSKYDPGPPPTSELRVYEATAEGIKLTIHIVLPNGQIQDEASTYRLDGKSYPLTGTANIDAIRVTRINARETRAAEMRDGKVIGHLTKIISKDGKSLILTLRLRTPSGQAVHDVRIYDRQ